MSSLPAGWPSSKPQEGRILVRRGKKPVDPPSGSWSSRDLHLHVKGRADCTAQILLGVSLLKQKGFIWNYVVNHTGAVWQDWKGTELSPRAHRLPCNPTITNRNIPDIAPTASLRDALIEPLATTDFLPKIANHCDSRFEALGAAESFAAAVRLVAREQERGKPVSFDLFHHALHGIALAGYTSASEAVLNEASAYINQETGPELLERNQNHSEKKPKTNMELVQETAYDLLRFTSAQSSTYLNQIAFKNEIARLDKLASGSDVINKPLRSGI